jgi:hypothetical protein
MAAPRSNAVRRAFQGLRDKFIDRWIHLKRQAAFPVEEHAAITVESRAV